MYFDTKSKKNRLFIIIPILIIGIFFRFYNLEGKIYWVDEVATSIRISGHTKQEIVEDFAASDSFNSEILQSYQKVQPGSALSETFSALIKSPEHVPLYFLVARFWVGIFGSSVVAIRSLSAIFSLFTLPSIYWLSSELFMSPKVGVISLLLFSISPFYVTYAQEARPYSLWTITILLSCTTFLRAVRLNNRQEWFTYSITTLISLYTSLLSVFVITGQIIYLAIVEKIRFNQKIRRHLKSLLIVLLGFLPWLLVIALHWTNFEDNTAWMRENMDFSAMIAIWITPILLIFGDLPFPQSLQVIKVTGIVSLLSILVLGIIFLLLKEVRSIQQSQSAQKYITIFLLISSLLSIIFILKNLIFQAEFDLGFLGGALIALSVITLILYSIYFSCVTLSTKQWLFIVISSISTPIALIVIDLILGGQSSGAPRYMIPSQLSLQVSVSYLLFAKGFSLLSDVRSRYLWRLITVLLIVLGIVSCTLNLNKSPFYQKSRNIHNLPIASILNSQETAIVLSEPSQTLDLLSLSHNLSPDIKIYPFNSSADLFPHLNQGKKVYIFNPSISITNDFVTQNISGQLVYNPERLVANEIVLTLWSAQKE